MNLIFEVLMAFTAFGSVAVLFASIIALTIWIVIKIVGLLLDF